MPKTCEDCRCGRVQSWDRDAECSPTCFWEDAVGWPYQMWRLFLEIAQGERISDDRTQWSIDHHALRNYLDYRDPLTDGCEPWEVLRAMQLVKREMNIGVRNPFELLDEVPLEDDQ